MSLTNILSQIRDEAIKLNELSDETYQTFKLVEQLLDKWSVGIEAEYILTNGYVFKYGRHKGKFKFYLEDDEGSKTPIESLRRNVRIEMAARLPHLLNLILNRIVDQQNSVPKSNVPSELKELYEKD